MAAVDHPGTDSVEQRPPEARALPAYSTPVPASFEPSAFEAYGVIGCAAAIWRCRPASMNRWKVVKRRGGVLQARGPEGQDLPFGWPVFGRQRSKLGQRTRKIRSGNYPFAFQDRGQQCQPIAMRLNQRFDSQLSRSPEGEIPRQAAPAEPCEPPFDHRHGARSINRRSRDG